MRYYLLTLMLCAVAANAATYYVRTDGNDANAGTADSSGGAWLTITNAVAQVSAGDTVYVRAGTYTNYVNLTTSGTAANPIRWFGQRDVDGSWLTIIDPSVVIDAEWTEASEIGSDVWKTGFSDFSIDHLTVDDYVVMSFSSTYAAGQEADLGRAADSTVNLSSFMSVPFWDGVEAGWSHTNDVLLVRFRDNTHPTNHTIRASSNDGAVGQRLGRGGVVVRSSYNTVQDFHIKGSYWGVGLIADETYTSVAGNTIRSNLFNHGFGAIRMDGGASTAAAVATNTISYNIIHPKGIWETAGVTGGSVRYDRDDTWPNYNHYYMRKYWWANSDEGGVIILDSVRNGNAIIGNVFSNVVHGIAADNRQAYKDAGLAATNTVIASNLVYNASGALVRHGQGYSLTSIYQNDVRNAWMGVTRLQDINKDRAYDNTVYIYRNRCWNPNGLGTLGYFHWEGVGTFQTEAWFYHNSYEGGQYGWTVGSNLPDGTMQKCRFFNNVVSSEGVSLYVSSASVTGASDVALFDYNRVRSSPSRGWVGGNNITLSSYPWGGLTASESWPSFEITEAFAEYNAGRAKVGSEPDTETMYGLAWDIGSYELTPGDIPAPVSGTRSTLRGRAIINGRWE